MIKKLIFKLRFKMSRKFRDKKWKELSDEYKQLENDCKELIEFIDKMEAE